MIKLLNNAASLVALLLVSFTAAAAVCTPATINPSSIARIVPRTSIATVQATLGCAPSEIFIAEDVSVTIYRFAVPLLNGGVYVAVDAMGVSFAQYLDPLISSHNSAMRLEPPLTPQWILSAGMILP